MRGRCVQTLPRRTSQSGVIVLVQVVDVSATCQVAVKNHRRYQQVSKPSQMPVREPTPTGWLLHLPTAADCEWVVNQGCLFERCSLDHRRLQRGWVVAGDRAWASGGQFKVSCGIGSPVTCQRSDVRTQTITHSESPVTALAPVLCKHTTLMVSTEKRHKQTRDDGYTESPTVGSSWG